MSNQGTSGKLTPKENIFRKPLAKSSQKEAASPGQVRNPESGTSATANFAVFDVVVDPGSEANIKTNAELQEDKENAAKAKSLTAYMPVVGKNSKQVKPQSKKRRVSEMTKSSNKNNSNSKSASATSTGVKTRKLSDFFSKKSTQ